MDTGLLTSSGKMGWKQEWCAGVHKAVSSVKLLLLAAEQFPHGSTCREGWQRAAWLWSLCSPTPVVPENPWVCVPCSGTLLLPCSAHRSSGTGLFLPSQPSLALAASPHSLGPHLLTRTWDFSGKQGLIPQETNNVGFQIALGWGKQG